jgi:hypothetical protein
MLFRPMHVGWIALKGSNIWEGHHVHGASTSRQLREGMEGPGHKQICIIHKYPFDHLTITLSLV